MRPKYVTTDILHDLSSDMTSTLPLPGFAASVLSSEPGLSSPVVRIEQDEEDEVQLLPR